MPAWYQTHPDGAAPAPAQRVFITGAAGRVGRCLAEALHTDHALTLMARPVDDAEGLAARGEVVRADLSQKDTLAELMGGHDTLIHLAANASTSATWDELIEPNVIGMQHAFAAAVEAGVGRIVFASSVNAVGSAPAETQPIHPGAPVSPGNLYGATKCFGEAVGHALMRQHGVTFFAVRLGAFMTPAYAHEQHKPWPMQYYISPRDCAQLFRLCLENTTLRYAIVHGLSHNDREMMDIASMRELLGYEPVDAFHAEQR